VEEVEEVSEVSEVEEVEEVEKGEEGEVVARGGNLISLQEPLNNLAMVASTSYQTDCDNAVAYVRSVNLRTRAEKETESP
jgi:hypothetical protein